MTISDFNFDLPENLIAQTPLVQRADSRMLIVNRAQQNFSDARFVDLPDLLNENSVLVVNNTKVFPARLIGNRENLTGKIEIFLIRETAENVWETLARPARRLKENTVLIFGGKLKAVVRQKNDDGRVIVEFERNADFYQTLEEIGQTPLPPYIRRAAEDSLSQDRQRYQTVFADKRGAIAAPTAGLHFTPEILETIRARNIEIIEITLHVGYGTFEPVRVTDLAEHKVAPESSEISAEAASKLNAAKKAGKKIVAIGTTTTRALEAATGDDGEIQSGAKFADLTITPGYKFKTVNSLLTNFHLPQSSLLVLTATFAGHDLTMRAYAHAVAAEYRFYSYGDCMLIE